MEEESLDVFCETVPSGYEETESEGLNSPQFRVEYAQGEDCDIEQGEGVYDEDQGDQEYDGEQDDKEISFEAEITDDIEISQNDVDEEVHEQMAAYEEGDDPTETLQKVLMDQELVLQQIIPIKQEPLEEEDVDVMSTEFKPTTSSMSPVDAGKLPEVIPSHTHSLDPSPVMMIKLGSAVKKFSTTTRSGRKSTFIKVQQKKVPRKKQINDIPLRGRPRGRKSKLIKVQLKKKLEKNPVSEEPPLPGPSELTEDVSPQGNAECLVCKAPCIMRKNKKLPSYHPFCKKCKKAFFYQQSKRQSPSPRICPKGGNCIIDHRCQQNWCPCCHLNKFNKILSSLCADDNPYHEEMVDMYHYKPLRPGPRGGEQDASLTNYVMTSSPSVLLERMTAEQLAEYGIASEPPVKQEPVDYEQYTSHPIKPITPLTSLSKKRHSTEPAPGNVKKGRRRKILMTTIPSSSESENEANTCDDGTINHQSHDASNDDDYALPKVNIGHDTVFSRHSGPQSRFPTSQINTEKQKNYTEVLDSIKVYVFTCGHACGLCNSLHSKKWLKESGFYTAKPILPSIFPSPKVSQSALYSHQNTKLTNRITSAHQNTIPTNKVTSAHQNTKPTNRITSAHQNTIATNEITSAHQNTKPTNRITSAHQNTIPTNRITSAQKSNPLKQSVVLKSVSNNKVNFQISSSPISQEVLRNLLESNASKKIQTGTQQQPWITLPISLPSTTDGDNVTLKKQLGMSPKAIPSQRKSLVSNTASITQSSSVNSAKSITVPVMNVNNQKNVTKRNNLSSPVMNPAIIEALKTKFTKASIIPSNSHSTSNSSSQATATELSVKQILQTLKAPSVQQVSQPVQSVSTLPVQSVPTIPVQSVTYQNLLELQKQGFKFTPIVPSSQAQSTSARPVASVANTNQIPVPTVIVVDKPKPCESKSKDILQSDQ